jgi:ParB family chromosome partitioning protein
MRLEFHQLERRLEHLRVRRPDRQRRLLASLAASGQQVPIVVVAVENQPNRYAVIDGYKRIAALQQLGRDTVQATVWEMSEAEALLLDRTLRFSPQESALEQGWLLSEMEQRFGYSLEELARRFDRSVSWVSRRLALVDLLPDRVQQHVRQGAIFPHVAMKYLVPVARANLADCQRMAEGFAIHRFNSRQAGQVYAAWRDASPQVRQRILDQPQLFLKAQEQVEPETPPPADQLLRDLTLVLSITNRASRRLPDAAPLLDQDQLETAQRKVEVAIRDLKYLAQKIQKEQQHVKQESTNRDSGTPHSGNTETRDRASSQRIPLVGAQSPAIAILGYPPTDPSRESRAVPVADPGTTGPMQGQSGPGP